MPENFGVAPQMLGANLDMPEKFGPMLCSWVDAGTRAAGSVAPDTSRQAGLGMVGATGLEPTRALASGLVRARSDPVASALGVTLGVRGATGRSRKADPQESSLTAVQRVVAAPSTVS